MKRQTIALLILATIIALSCSFQPTELLRATETLLPTETPVPSKTPTAPPTDTPIPEPTDTPAAKAKDTATPERLAIATSRLEDGWIFYELIPDEFGIAIPPSWLQIDLDPETFEQAIGIAVEANPQFQGVLSGETLQGLIARGIKFYALDMDPSSLEGGMPTTLNVLKINLGAAIPLDAYVPINLAQIDAIASPEVPVTHQRVNLGNIEAEKITYATNFEGMGGESTGVMLMQYLAVEGVYSYVITLASPLGLADQPTATFEQIGKSFQVLD